MGDPIKKHWAVYVKNTYNRTVLITELLNGNGFINLSGEKIAVFSQIELDRYIDGEDRHDQKIITKDTSQSLSSMSSGEQKKVLLQYLLNSKPDYILLDNPFDNLDLDSQKQLQKQLITISEAIGIIQLMGRKNDLLPFIKNMVNFDGRKSTVLKDLEESPKIGKNEGFEKFKGQLPKPMNQFTYTNETLISFKEVCASYGGKPVLQSINWEVKLGEFWQLIGKNGSGKTTMLTMVTGDNPKGYGQELYLFGQKKGSGESVWDIKRKIGYFTPSMTHKFTGYHTVEYMLLSGFYDSMGLYTAPTEHQLRLAREWLLLIGMWELKYMLFHDLTMGQQRLLMVARAMIKHPLLLILDEPTAGLDDESASLFVALVNKIALGKTTAIIFVSHREEPGLKSQFTYELIMKEHGSVGRAL